MKKLVKQLRQVCQSNQVWDSHKAKTDYPFAWFQATTRAEPAHCTFLGAPTPFARWTDFPDTALPVYYGSAGDPGCGTANSKVQSVISSLNTNYTGLNLTDGGTHAFIPSCTGPMGDNGATDSEFTDWIDTNLGSTRHLLVQYDDPCDEIADLGGASGCNGTLAFGGFYWFGSTHVWDGTNWNPGAYGYVVVNNGTGTCQCPSTDYDIMMTHEITHALGIGHVAPANGNANMNPSCCETISTLDVECLDYTYAPAVLPVELQSFSGKLIDKNSHLEWTTISEKNNDFFLLERSIDGHNFDMLGRVSGNGTTAETNTYHFVDQQPELGKNYYRLSQTDYDGRTEVVGDIVVIEYGNDGIISIRPNPVSGNKMQLVMVAEQTEPIAIKIYDLNGRLVRNTAMDLTRGRNELDLEVGHLSNGIYFVHTQIGSQIQSHRIVKTNF